MISQDRTARRAAQWPTEQDLADYDATPAYNQLIAELEAASAADVAEVGDDL